jgi:hypothetical protein
MLILNDHSKTETEMAASRISNSITLSSSIHERRQTQARIRAIQQRTSELLIWFLRTIRMG